MLIIIAVHSALNVVFAGFGWRRNVLVPCDIDKDLCWYWGECFGFNAKAWGRRQGDGERHDSNYTLHNNYNGSFLEDGRVYVISHVLSSVNSRDFSGGSFVYVHGRSWVFMEQR